MNELLKTLPLLNFVVSCCIPEGDALEDEVEYEHEDDEPDAKRTN